MANRGDHPTVPPRLRGITTANTHHRRRFTSPPRRRVNLTEENQSLLDSFRSSAALTPQETATCTQSLFRLMTSSDASQFTELISRLDEEGSDLRKMAVLLTSDVGRFLEMARNKNGSNRVPELFGKTDDVDTFFFNAIMHRFFRVMIDLNASRLGMQGMRVFSQAKKTAMYDYVLHHAVRLACDRVGFMVLKQIITDWSGTMDHSFLYRDRLLYIVSQNALRLSFDAHGNYVVQHVLRLNDLRCTHTTAFRLSGHCVRLSFTKLGSYVVKKLLDTEAAGVVVVGELLWGCDGESLVRLARNEFGSYVVEKALRVMQERNRTGLFWGLVYKLMPFVHHLRGLRIGAVLDSIYY